MAFFFASSPSNSESASLSSSPDVTPLDNLKDDHNRSPTGQTQGEGTSPTLASGLSSPRDHPFSRAESEVYTTATNPGLEHFIFDVGVDASKISSAPSSRSSSYIKSSESSGSELSSYDGSERGVSPTLTKWATLGEASHSGGTTASVPTSASSAPTIKPHAISSNDKGKAPAYPSTMRTDEEGPHRRRGSGETKSIRSTKHERARVVYESGVSRDFLLIVALCVGLACAGILVVRPAILALYGLGGFDLDEL